MLSWSGQAIIVIQTYIHEKVVLRESSVQYAFGQERNPLLIRTIHIPMGILIPLNVLIHKLSPCSLSDGLLGARKIWHKTTITMTIIHPIVTKGSAFGVFALCMSVTMTLVIL
jgi:hypothetical protein